MEKISIIVPIYNVEKYLRKCLLSIINQTYSNIEILLIDDGSTDNSSQICDEFALKDSRIKVIHKKNEGVSKAKNCGLKESSSNYVAFIDSDDTISNNYIETLYTNLISTNSYVAILGYNVVKENGSIIYDSTDHTNLKKDEIVVYEGLDIIKELLLQKTVKNFGCKLYKKSVLCEFEVGVTYEDIVFSLKVMENSNRIVYINKNYYYYLKRNNSITSTITEKNLIDFSDAIKARYDLVNKKYPELENYNIYAFFESTLAICSKDMVYKKIYKVINKRVEKFLSIIIDNSASNDSKFMTLLNDYEKHCLSLARNSTDSLYSFLKSKNELRLLQASK